MYVIYSALRATASCAGSALTTIGPSFKEKTIGYSSRFLAYGTLSSPDQRCDENVVVDGFHTIDFTSLYYNPITTATTTKAGCAPYVNPRLSLPHELTNVDLSWASCEPLFYGAFDPPRVLRRAGALAPPAADPGTVTKSPDITPSPSPTPPADPSAPTPKATQAPGSQDVTYTSGQIVPVNNAPSFLSPQRSNVPQPTNPSPANTQSPATGNDLAKASPPQPQQGGTQPATQDQTHAQDKSLPPDMNPGVSGDNTGKAPPQQPGVNVDGASPKQVGVAPSQPGGNQKSGPEPAGSQPQSHDNNAAGPGKPGTYVRFVGSPPKVDDQTVQKQANGNVVVGDITVLEGHSTSISGHEVANNRFNVVVDGTAHDIIPAVSAPVGTGTNGNVPFVGPAPLIGGQIAQKQANGNVLVGGTTILEGQTASVDGHQVVNTPSHVIVDGTSHAVAPIPEDMNGQSRPTSKEGGSTQTQFEGTSNNAGSRTGNSQNEPGPIFDPNPIVINTSKTSSQQASTGSSTDPTNENPSNSENPIPGTDSPLPNPNLPIAEAFSNPNSKPPFPIPTAPRTTQHVAQLRVQGLPVHSALSRGLLIGTQTIPLNAHTTIAGFSVSVGGASIVLDGTTYAIALNPTPPAMLPPVIPSAVPEDGSPFTLPIPDEKSVNIASLSLSLPGAQLEVLSGGAGVLVMGFHPTTTISGAAGRPVDTGEAGIGDAILRAFSPSGPSSVGDGAPVFIMVPDQSTSINRANGTGWHASGGIHDSIVAQGSVTGGFGTIATGAAVNTATGATKGIINPSISALAKSSASKAVGLSGRWVSALLFPLGMMMMMMMITGCCN